jgi:hypothetical protein
VPRSESVSGRLAAETGEPATVLEKACARAISRGRQLELMTSVGYRWIRHRTRSCSFKTIVLIGTERLDCRAFQWYKNFVICPDGRLSSVERYILLCAYRELTELTVGAVDYRRDTKDRP